LPASVELRDAKSCDLTIQEGKYHQVKRMFAAVGNRVESIHRVAIGSVKLDDGLAAGQWRWLAGNEIDSLGFKEP
jgi:16S rRNA pseudouridine516 synthase